MRSKAVGALTGCALPSFKKPNYKKFTFVIPANAGIYKKPQLESINCGIV
jgi:hypothetical protein